MGMPRASACRAASRLHGSGQHVDDVGEVLEDDLRAS
jgi:hypothetical protein